MGLPLTETAWINTGEGKGGIFPYESWAVTILNTDDKPPHLHVMRDGWNVCFSIGDGEVLWIETKGDEESHYNYMVQNVMRWLDAQCTIEPRLTNRENAKIQWRQLHDR